MKDIKIFLPCFILIWSSTTLLSQSSPWLVFHAYNWQILNPAALNRYFYQHGDKTEDPPVRFTGAVRSEGFGIKNAPLTGFINSEVLYPRFRWGARLMFDQTDAISNLDGSINLCYRLTPGNKKLKVSMALQPAIFGYQVNINKLHPSIAVQNDPFFAYYESRRWRFDCGWGIFMRRLRTRKAPRSELYAGIALPNLVLLSRRRSVSISNGGSERTTYVNVMGGIIQDLGENSTLEITSWIRTLAGARFHNFLGHKAGLSLDTHLRWHINGQDYRGYWLGGGLGTHGVGSLEFGWSDSKIFKRQLALAVSGAVFHPKERFANNPLGVEIMFTHYIFDPPNWMRFGRGSKGANF